VALSISDAYVKRIIRAGINSVDKGQMGGALIGMPPRLGCVASSFLNRACDPFHRSTGFNNMLKTTSLLAFIGVYSCSWTRTFTCCEHLQAERVFPCGCVLVSL
jgi:ABC-type amino acid transport system permease subunit